MRVLRLNSPHQRDVKLLQTLLKIKDDGIFGNNTRNAVVDFQRKNGLLDDGVVGPKTWSALLNNTKLKTEEKPKQVITPITTTTSNEDLDDPEVIENNLSSTEEQVSCDNFNQLTEIILNSRITRNITELFLHCTASNQNASVSSIQRYWRESLGWKSPGYHIIIKPDGTFTYLLDFNQISNGVRGRNSISVNISYIGGIDSRGRAMDNRTEEQKITEEMIIKLFTQRFPRIKLRGHNEVTNKACPSYNVKQYYSKYIK
jgi:N-acetylmuramoyl-L-alanine amidase